MGEIKNVNLQFSCQEQKNISKEKRGYYCGKCARNLIDFRDKSSTKFQNITSKSPFNICGIFKKSQLSKEFVKYAAAAIIVTTSMTFSSYAQEITSADTLEGITETEENLPLFGVITEIVPEPIGGYKQFFENLANHIKLPKGLKEKEKIFIQFSVDTLGNASDYRVLKSFNKLAGDEAVRALKTLDNKFTPGLSKTKLIIPIIFDPKRK